MKKHSHKITRYSPPRFLALLFVFLIVSLLLTLKATLHSTPPNPKAFTQKTPASFLSAIQLQNSVTEPYGTSIDIPVNPNIDSWSNYWSIEGWFKPENPTYTTTRQYLFFIPIINAV